MKTLDIFAGSLVATGNIAVHFGQFIVSTILWMTSNLEDTNEKFIDLLKTFALMHLIVLILWRSLAIIKTI